MISISKDCWEGECISHCSGVLQGWLLSGNLLPSLLPFSPVFGIGITVAGPPGIHNYIKNNHIMIKGQMYIRASI